MKLDRLYWVIHSLVILGLLGAGVSGDDLQPALLFSRLWPCAVLATQGSQNLSPNITRRTGGTRAKRFLVDLTPLKCV